MLWLLKVLVIGHVHRWKTDEWVVLQTTGGSRGRRYYQQCEKCGIAHKVDCV
jgi:hypothetical protein